MSLDPTLRGSINPDAAGAERMRALEARLDSLERGGRRAVSAWQTPSLVNGFGGGPNAPVGYYIDSLGRVYLRGTPTVPNVSSRPLTIFTLATGYRPAYTHRFVCAGEFADSIAEVIVDVGPAGAVALSFSGFFGQQINLDEISFRTI